MKYFHQLINHHKASRERINKMRENGWTDKEIAEKFAYMEKCYNHIDAFHNRVNKILEH